MKREQFFLSALLHRATKLYNKNLHGYASIEDEKLKDILETAEKWALGGKKPEQSIPKTSLKPILERLNRDKNYTASYNFEPKKLELHENFFPQKKTNANATYTILLDELEKELKNLPITDPSVFIENCYNLSHKYTVTIPFHSALPDVPLFDHCKTTTAFAICIYDYLQETQKGKIEPVDKPVLFLGGSISGIQNYIYNIISQFASKNLKGRSFYLQLLIDSIIEKILHELQLFHANIIYASGGGFYMLVPNTEFVQQKVKELEKLISDKLFDQFKLGLTINIESIPLSENDFMQGEINEKWKELTNKINEKKRKKHADRFSSDYSCFFETAEEGGALKKDTITNEEITAEHFAKNHVFEVKEDSISEKPSTHPEPDKTYILKLTKQQIDLGQNLRETNFIIKTMQRVPEWEEKALHHENPLDLGVYWYFFDNLPPKNEQKTTLIQLNNPEKFLQVDWNDKSKTIHDFTFYGGNKIPRKKSKENSKFGFEPKNFNDLAGEEEDSFKRLAILRMDVDNLGNAFKEGLGKESLTFSKYSTLSRSLDYFFKGYINTIRKKNDAFKEWIYIV